MIFKSLISLEWMDLITSKTRISDFVSIWCRSIVRIQDIYFLEAMGHPLAWSQIWSPSRFEIDNFKGFYKLPKPTSTQSSMNIWKIIILEVQNIFRDFSEILPRSWVYRHRRQKGRLTPRSAQRLRLDQLDPGPRPELTLRGIPVIKKLKKELEGLTP